MANSFRPGSPIHYGQHITRADVLAPFIKATLGKMGYGFYEVLIDDDSDGKTISVGNVVLEVAKHKDFDIRWGQLDTKEERRVLGFLERAVEPYDSSEAVVRENSFVDIMSVAGHELGHAFSERLVGDISEEAKAYAFEMAWSETIAKYNVGGLGDKVLEMMLRTPDAERSPIHYRAHQKVMDLSKKMPAIQVYEDIKSRRIWIG
ncbi:MAG: hypothetical protein AABW82_01095 [Nanoarchaeota archaeon]